MVMPSYLAVFRLTKNLNTASGHILDTWLTHSTTWASSAVRHSAHFPIGGTSSLMSWVHVDIGTEVVEHLTQRHCRFHRLTGSGRDRRSPEAVSSLSGTRFLAAPIAVLNCAGTGHPGGGKDAHEGGSHRPMWHRRECSYVGPGRNQEFPVLADRQACRGGSMPR